MNRRALYLIGAALLIAFAGFAVAAFQDSLTPYVSFEQARSGSRPVQVAGGLVEDSSSYDLDRETLLFELREPATGETLRVRYHGIKPANFEDAVSIVAIGSWDATAGELEAQKLLVKCPSKYQGAEAERAYGA